MITPLSTAETEDAMNALGIILAFWLPGVLTGAFLVAFLVDILYTRADRKRIERRIAELDAELKRLESK